MPTVLNDLGPMTRLFALRQQALRQYEHTKDFRWHGERWLKLARNYEFEIRWAMLNGTDE